MARTKLLKKISDDATITDATVTLAAVEADGNGTAVPISGKNYISAVVTAASVTTGATLTFEASADGTVWAPVGFEGIAGTRVASQVIGADGSTTWKIDGVNAGLFIRGVIGSRTDGTFTVTIMAN